MKKIDWKDILIRAVKTFLEARFAEEDRFQRRLRKITDLESAR